MPLTNLNSAHLTEAQVTAAQNALTELENALAIITVQLTPEDRQKYGSINEQNKLLVNKVKDFRQSNPNLSVSDVDWDEFDKDFASRNVFESLINRLNALLIKLKEDTKEAESLLGKTLIDLPQVASVAYYRDASEKFEDSVVSLNAVVYAIILCAALLAFVVLYNLTNINLSERLREIATIKVLGFYDPEVYAYVNRESVALTLIGTLLGLAGGIALHSFVITTVEVDAVMFGRQIYPQSFAYAIALTLLFSTLVNLVMQRLLKRISMVESMKAPE